MQFRWRKVSFVAIVYFLAGAGPCLAEVWIDLKLGAADSNPSLTAQINAISGNRLYSLTNRYGSYMLDNRYYRELSVGYGRRHSFQYGVTTLQIGFGLIELEHNESQPRIEPTIPIMATVTLGKYLGISGSAHININRIKPPIGVELGMAFGKFR